MYKMASECVPERTKQSGARTQESVNNLPGEISAKAQVPTNPWHLRAEVYKLFCQILKYFRFCGPLWTISATFFFTAL